MTAVGLGLRVLCDFRFGLALTGLVLCVDCFMVAGVVFPGYFRFVGLI